MSLLIQQNSGALHKVIIKESIEQMDKFQDQTYSGNGIDIKSGKNFKYAMITDGHGKNDCIDILRNISKDEMAILNLF